MSPIVALTFASKASPQTETTKTSEKARRPSSMPDAQASPRNRRIVGSPARDGRIDRRRRGPVTKQTRADSQRLKKLQSIEFPNIFYVTEATLVPISDIEAKGVAPLARRDP